MKYLCWKCRKSTIGLLTLRSTSANTPSSTKNSACIGRWYVNASGEVNDSSPGCKWFVDRIRTDAQATISPAPMKSIGPESRLSSSSDSG